MPRFNFVKRAAIICVVLITATAAQSPTIDPGSCHDDLDYLRKAASEASEAADNSKSKRDDFDDCKQYPETYDLMHDNCRSAAGDYQSALNDLEGKMDDLDGRQRSVQDSCGYQFTINKLNSSEVAQRRLEAAQRRLCASYHKMFDLGMSRDTALQMCKSQTDEQWCKQCLGLK
jgi:hypothetical protein